MKKVKNNQEAMDFLENVVRPNGAYRIHTSKKGVKVYVDFMKEGVTGLYKSFKNDLRLEKMRQPHGNDYYNSIRIYHLDHFELSVTSYNESFQGKDFLKAVNMHIVNLPLGSVVNPNRGKRGDEYFYNGSYENFLKEFKHGEKKGMNDTFVKTLKYETK